MNVFTKQTRTLGGALAALLILLPAGTMLAGDAEAQAVLPPLKTITTLGSTVPANGDVNPYGVAQIKRTIGNLRAGHILVSNFNNAGNFQGEGSTIVDVAPDGSGVSLFATLKPATLKGSCPGGVGLTTALVVLREGWVIVGSLPTSTQGTVFTGSGCLIVLDSLGNPVETFYGSLINGPWDMTAFESNHEAKLFVTNVLNGTVAAGGAVVHAGTVTRLNLTVSATAKPVLESITVIGSGFPQRTDPAALVIGPTGVGLRVGCDDDCGDQDDQGDGDHGDSSVLYVADTLGNRVTMIDRALSRTSSAGTGRTLSTGGSLNGPLGLVVTPGGHVLTVNSADGFITEISPQGMQVAKKQLDNTPVPGSLPGAGTLFGLAFDPTAGVYFVDDGINTLNLLHR